MEALGYPATWPTTCFIAGGCGARVFAHTNGYGDFVVFDELGWPWQVHECYTNRFLLAAPSGTGLFTVRHDSLHEYRRAEDRNAPPPREISPADIKRIEPLSMLGETEFPVVGYVQDYVERQADRLARLLGDLGQQAFYRILGTKKSQLTIVTSELKSYTVFADLSNVVVKRKDSVLARVTAVRVFGVRGREALFLANEVLLIRGDSRA